MTIFLVRHGETDANAARVLQKPEAPLSARGLAQAGRLAERLAREPIAQILSSDLARAVMTAERLSQATGAPLSLDPLLQERNFGALRGTPYSELAENPFAPDYQPPEGESWESFDARVDAAWIRVGEVRSECAGPLVVVTHGLVCRSLLMRHAVLAKWEVPDRFDNTSLSVLDSEPPHRVRLLNCTAHLDEASGPRSAGSAGPPGGLA